MPVAGMALVEEVTVELYVVAASPAGAELLMMVGEAGEAEVDPAASALEAGEEKPLPKAGPAAWFPIRKFKYSAGRPAG